MKKQAKILTTHEGHKAQTDEPSRKNPSIRAQKNLKRYSRKSKRA